MADPGGGEESNLQETDKISEENEKQVAKVEENEKTESKDEKEVEEVPRASSAKKELQPISEQKQEKVDLSKIKPKYNTKSHSTMSNVLTEYGFIPPVENRRQTQQKTHKKKPPPRKAKRESTFDSTTSDDGDKMTEAKKEKYMQVYEDIHKLRDYFYEDYMTQLREKVDKQREDIQKKSMDQEKKIREREEKERSGRFKKRLERVDPKTNEEFLKKIPKSDYYKIVNLQEKMSNEGRFKNQSDIDHFWREMRRPEVFQQYFPDTSSDSSKSQYSDSQRSRSYSRSSSISSADKSQVGPVIQTDFRPMTQIEETNEVSRPPTQEQGRRESWAITQQAQAVHKAPAKKVKDPYTIAKTAAIELDRKYPAIELPKLNCFSAPLDHAEIELHQILKEKEKERREKERRLFVMRLRRMYHLTQSNQASAQRILDNHAEELELARNGPPLSELMALSALTSDPPPVEERDPNADRPWLRHLVSKRREIQTIDELPEEGELTTRWQSLSGSGSRGTSASSKRSKKRMIVPSPPPPISRGLLEDLAPIKEAKCLSTMWTNYLRIGFHGDLASLQPQET